MWFSRFVVVLLFKFKLEPTYIRLRYCLVFVFAQLTPTESTTIDLISDILSRHCGLSG